MLLSAQAGAVDTEIVEGLDHGEIETHARGILLDSI
ncbi:hypothetical protein SAMN05216281_11533 [Cryobacterium luteum]|nr:hypothetical protein SAMN05216281_11533 [Cryobacterium luteum]